MHLDVQHLSFMSLFLFIIIFLFVFFALCFKNFFPIDSLIQSLLWPYFPLVKPKTFALKSFLAPGNCPLECTHWGFCSLWAVGAKCSPVRLWRRQGIPYWIPGLLSSQPEDMEDSIHPVNSSWPPWAPGAQPHTWRWWPSIRGPHRGEPWFSQDLIFLSLIAVPSGTAL